MIALRILDSGRLKMAYISCDEKSRTEGRRKGVPHCSESTVAINHRDTKMV